MAMRKTTPGSKQKAARAGKVARQSKAARGRSPGLKVRRAAVIGLGYVGLPLAVEMARAGIEVVGLDVDEGKVATVNAGRSHITDISDAEVSRWVKAGRLTASSDFDRLRTVEAVSICVPTPLRKTKDPDVSFISASVEQLAPRLQPGQIIILESTSYPGTTDEMLLPILSENGRQAGRDFYLAFSPERVDPGNPVYKTRNTPKVIGGVTPECTRAAFDFYSRIFETVIPVSSTRSAEMVKLLENTFRAVNIGLVNEVALMCNRLGLDVWEIINAAATKPFGFMPFFPGPGLGGHCIPVDPLYLSWKLKSLNYTARFIELATEINAAMPIHVATRIGAILNDVKKPVRGSKILVLGVAYKKNVGDVRESPAIDIIHLLKEKGAEVEFHDPHVPVLMHAGLEMKSVPIAPRNLKGYDLVVIVTDHEVFDYERVANNAPLVFDTRNATLSLGPRKNIVKL